MSRAEDTALAYTILGDLLLGFVTFHRRPDAWDILDDQKRVAAIICTRVASAYVSISLPLGPKWDRPKAGARIVKPYDEELIAYVTQDGSRPKRSRNDGAVLLTVGMAREFLSVLVRSGEMARTHGIELAQEVRQR